jgi:diguanylate cyclase (GGDEF)-like protein/PAS domain S-box-containing protein
MAQARTKLPALGFPFRESAALLENIMENALIGMALVGIDGRVLYTNRSYADMFGYTREECVGLGVADLVPDQTQQEAQEQLAKLASGEIASYRAERLYRRKDDTRFWGRVSASILRDNRAGQPIYVIVQVEDIDSQKTAEAALVESERRWNAALEGAGQGVWDHDLRNNRVFYSRMWRLMRGFGLDEDVDSSREAWLARVHPDDRQRISDQADRQNSGALAQNAFEYRERHRDGHYIWILSRGRPIEWMPDGSVARIVGTDTDITSLKLEEARTAEETAETYRRHLAALEQAQEATEEAHRLAESLARHDPLTGLPNRRVFAESLDKAIAAAKRGSRTFAVLIIDLDRFKPVNDIHGHPIGDYVLREIAGRLAGIVRKSDTLARLGGDEFGAILECDTEDVTPADAAVRFASRLATVVQAPIIIGDKSIEVGATVGIAMCPDDGADPDKLLRAADMAMYRAKDEQRGTFCFFQRDMEVELRSRAKLEHDVQRAVAEEHIRPHYQPLMKLAENRLVGFEILARWHHPDRGDVPPEEFIPVVERLGLLGKLTYSLLREACLVGRDWPSDIALSINVSAKHFSDPLLPVKFLAILSETGYPPTRLEVEITESALLTDPANARNVLSALQGLGIKISLDDFGTGYSNLYHLRELRFDKVKIDRSFVTTMGSDNERAKIVHSVIGLARNLGLPTVAEGIEQSETLDLLVQDGAEFGQGFLFGRAMAADAADRLVQSASEYEQTKGSGSRRA